MSRAPNGFQTIFQTAMRVNYTNEKQTHKQEDDN